MIALPKFTKWILVSLCVLAGLLVVSNFSRTGKVTHTDTRRAMKTTVEQKPSELVRLWFFALDCDKPHLEFIAKQAVLSARYYTNLVPILMLHCKNAELEGWMVRHGVTIVDPGNSKLVKFLDANPDKLTNLGASTWYRIAIPTVIDELIASKHDQITKLSEQNPSLLEYALYTDADIVFVNNIAFQPSMLPRYFSLPVQGDALCCSNNPYGAKVHTNAGVILMNVTSFREVEDEFTAYVLKHIVNNKVGDLSFNDQTAFHDFFPIHMKRVTWLQTLHMALFYSTYYKLMYTKYYSDTLPKEYEWEPYLGVNPDAVIVHWHGPKVSMESCAQLHPHKKVHPAKSSNGTVDTASTTIPPMVTTGPGRSLFADSYQTVLQQLLLHDRTAPYVLPTESHISSGTTFDTLTPAAAPYPPTYDWYTPMQLSPEDRALVLKNGERSFFFLQTLTKDSLEGYHYATSLYFAYMNVICSHRKASKQMDPAVLSLLIP